MASNLQLVLFSLFTLLSFQAIVSAIEPQLIQHPLDPLTEQELNLIRVTVLNKYPSSSHKLSFHYVGLDDPDKATILQWASSLDRSSVDIPRSSFVIALVDGQTHEITIDLKTQSIISDNIHTGNGFPTLTVGEQGESILLPLSYPPFIESLNKRGLNLSEVVCSPFSVGWYGEEKSKRIVRVECFMKENTANIYVRPINGIKILADLEQMKIVEYHDDSIQPVPKAENTEYRRELLKGPYGPKLHGISSAQPEGPGFKIDGHSVR